ncbi:alpha/beta fold hydrolase [Nocardioides sp. Kera G14]|uniref:alpha/beta fold hydrolase n=1 Tax=Nocardioides sp. Kera G14 TaxID=2884264 RepID=UPI001D12295F|nr:alpha/beta fold hydrolase [Nocardioides sp. Kera G14]UDY22292.1 alpha/beta hydrolase [Nocardioides sp. Kera G14]
MSPRPPLAEWVRRRARVPQVAIPEGRWLELPRRGRTWLTDIPGPTPEAPAVVLLHAVGCTGLLTWFPVLEALSEHYRVVTFDQRWHGRGIMSEAFSLYDCADDVAAVITELGLEQPIVAGYSMGGVIAQRTWRQHPDLIGGLVLCATTPHFRVTGPEMGFMQGLELGMGALRTLSRSRTARAAGRRTASALDVGPTDTGQWALAQWRSTSPWAVAQAVASLGRHNAKPWLGRIDVPTAVVLTAKDRVIPPERQRDLAARIPGATVHEADMGHAGCVMQADRFGPALLEAFATVSARRRDRVS